MSNTIKLVENQVYNVPTIPRAVLVDYLYQHGWHALEPFDAYQYFVLSDDTLILDDEVIPNFIQLPLDENSVEYSAQVSIAIYFIAKRNGTSATAVYSDIVGGNGLNLVSGSLGNANWNLWKLLEISGNVSKILRQSNPAAADSFDLIIERTRKNVCGE